jgi:hypothetical protein
MDCFVAPLLAMTEEYSMLGRITGGEIMRNDLTELTALNRDYVNSVQNSDVKRFDEILADDFYCSNPDKSLVDRAGFLKQTAVPVTIRNLEAHDVKIRLMGDFAIIHAATPPRTASRPRAATPIAGRGRTAAGSRYRRMCRGDKNPQRRPGESRDPYAAVSQMK